MIQRQCTSELPRQPQITIDYKHRCANRYPLEQMLQLCSTLSSCGFSLVLQKSSPAMMTLLRSATESSRSG
jgi:hypothetical protein